MWQVVEEGILGQEGLVFPFLNLMNIYRALGFLTKLCAFSYVGSPNPHKAPLEEELAPPFYSWKLSSKEMNLPEVIQ